MADGLPILLTSSEPWGRVPDSTSPRTWGWPHKSSAYSSGKVVDTMRSASTCSALSRGSSLSSLQCSRGQPPTQYVSAVKLPAVADDEVLARLERRVADAERAAEVSCRDTARVLDELTQLRERSDACYGVIHIPPALKTPPVTQRCMSPCVRASHVSEPRFGSALESRHHPADKGTELEVLTMALKDEMSELRSQSVEFMQMFAEQQMRLQLKQGEIDGLRESFTASSAPILLQDFT